MSNIVKSTSTGALLSVERAREILAKCISMKEIKEIRAVAQAVLTVERGKEIACDAGEIIVLADTRRADLEAEEKATRPKGNPTGANQHTEVGYLPGNLPKAQLVAESKRAPLLRLPAEDRQAYFDACRKTLEPPTPTGAAALSRLPEPERKQVIAKLASVPQVSRAIQDARREIAREHLENVATQETKRLQGIFDVVVADPPWPMTKLEREDRPNQTLFEYPTMSEEDILSLKIPAAANCHLFLWTTQRFLPLAFKCLESWGFVYSCEFIWHKPGGFQVMGMPQFNHEQCLYAKRGIPKFVDTKAFNTCFEAPRGAHSEKPEAFYEMIRRVTAGRRADMFNRRPIKGFETHGKEASST